MTGDNFTLTQVYVTIIKGIYISNIPIKLSSLSNAGGKHEHASSICMYYLIVTPADLKYVNVTRKKPPVAQR